MTHLSGDRPTKEMPLHAAFYETRRPGAVVHLHSTHSVALSMLPETDPDNALPPLTGPLDKVAADIRAYQAAGVDTMIFDSPRPDPAAMVTAMRRVARELRPRLARRSAPRGR